MPFLNTPTPTKKKSILWWIPTSPGIHSKPTAKRQIQENLTEKGPNDQIEEESALHIRELTEDWADVNRIIPSSFNPLTNSPLNKTHPEELWVETRTTYNQTVHWLADTGSPRSFLTLEKSKEILKDNPKLALQPYKSNTQYRCFENNNIKVEGTLQLPLESGSWTARDCQVLVVRHKTNNLMGRDILQKLGIGLQQRPKQSPGSNLNSISHIETEKNIIKWVLRKYPHFCSRIGKSKDPIAKSIFKQNHIPKQQKRRRVPLHLLEKVEIELDKLVQDKQIIKLEKRPEDLFVSPVVIIVKKEKSVKFALDSKKLKKAIHKNKCQMQSIEHLVDAVALHIT